MPPLKRKVSSSTASEVSDAAAEAEASTSSSVSKKAKAAPKSKAKVKAAPKKQKDTEPPFPCPSSEPVYPEIAYVNTALPDSYTLPEKVGDVKISAWNVTSIKSVCDPKHGSGFMGYMEQEDADIMILTETKRNNSNPIPQDAALKKKYPYQKWAYSSKPGYAGTAILSKIEPVAKTINLVVKGETITGRLVCLEFPTLYLVGTYVPNAGDKLANLQGKIDWNEAFEAKLRELDQVKPVVWGGDINVAGSARDLSGAERNWNKTPGWSEQEVSAYHRQLNPDPASGHLPLVDAWRALKGPDLVEYSFHSKRVSHRTKNGGWRIDTFVVSARLMARVKACEIRREIFGPSDHVPVVLELSGAL